MKMTYLTIFQSEHLIKKLTNLVKIVNNFYSTETFSQVEQSKMTCLIKMTHD
jgi:hypothetical protein